MRARTEGVVAAEAFRDLQLALKAAKINLPELRISDGADGALMFDLGRVGVRTAARLARVLETGC